MTQIFKKTQRQSQAIKLMGTDAWNIMMYGGARSAKTFTGNYAITVRASKTPSRHLIIRRTFNSVMKSVWLDTFPKMMKLAFPSLTYKPNNKYSFIEFPNGSEYWFGGLDNEKSMEKILGNEYSTIFFNECSEIPYAGVELLYSRLAEKNELVNKCYYDMNPPNKRHWSYQTFIKGINPKTGLQLPDGEYASILMNPMDNKENIDKNYFRVLANMSPEERARFELGEFSNASDGEAYYAFNQSDHTADLTNVINEKHRALAMIGMDFNVNPMTAVLGTFINDKFYIFDELYQNNSDTHLASKELMDKGYTGCRVYPDSTGGNRKTSGQSDKDILSNNGFRVEYTYNPYVTDRVNNLNRLFAQNRIIIDKKCVKLINDLEKVTWLGNKLDQKGANQHLTHISDALGYLCWALEPIAKVSNARIRGFS